MITLELARELGRAGLVWTPAKGDQFVVPDRGMDEQIFTINDMAVIVESLHGSPAITFHGTPEWALDYVLIAEAVWLPTEGQLRQQLEQRLAQAETPVYDLLFADGVYTCRFTRGEHPVAFRAANAPDAYGRALLGLLRDAEPNLLEPGAQESGPS